MGLLWALFTALTAVPVGLTSMLRKLADCHGVAAVGVVPVPRDEQCAAVGLRHGQYPATRGGGSGLMNTGFGVAGIISPVVFGALVQSTGNWALPFVLSATLLLVGAGLALRIDAHSGIDGQRPLRRSDGAAPQWTRAVNGTGSGGALCRSWLVGVA
jgi:MFS family permease